MERMSRMSRMSRLLGIDAGFAKMGVVIVELGDVGNGDPASRQILFAETCRTEPTPRKRGVRVADDDAERCQKLARFLIDTIRIHQPAGAVVELPSGGAQGARANRAMGMATGIVVAVLEMAELPVEWVTPGDVKLAATGRRDGSKDAVQDAVREAFDWEEGGHGDKGRGGESRSHWPRYKWAQEHVADAAAAVLAAEGGTLMRALERVSEMREETQGVAG